MSDFRLTKELIARKTKDGTMPITYHSHESDGFFHFVEGVAECKCEIKCLTCGSEYKSNEK